MSQDELRAAIIRETHPFGTSHPVKVTLVSASFVVREPHVCERLGNGAIQRHEERRDQAGLVSIPLCAKALPSGAFPVMSEYQRPVVVA